MAVVLFDDFVGTAGQQVKTRPGWGVVLNSPTGGPDTSFKVKLSGQAYHSSVTTNTSQYCVIGTDCLADDHRLVVKPVVSANPQRFAMRVTSVQPATYVKIYVVNNYFFVSNHTNNNAGSSTGLSTTFTAGDLVSCQITGDTFSAKKISGGTETTLVASFNVSSVPAGRHAGVLNSDAGEYTSMSFENDNTVAVNTALRTLAFFNLI